ncbi:DUF924 domain-containing protein [Sphingomonas sp. S1-29]|uniref:DUF924 family protein n=1 Tax=Sphingomonas sp. S1-29 TaxID=2991074 RepID=UPI00223EB2D0|nr:DUF924 family protein [Sphingomonas sp. S1-29]UZK69827.1 DUF924 domain-containing protein [Sphingomonas sp. S1-29]
MASDLGTDGGEVHAAAARVLAFWFDETPPERQFAQDAGFDAMIADRFGGLRDQVLETGAAAWRDAPEPLLAAVILLDQFTRNIHRGTARAFEADALGLELARAAIARGWDRAMPDAWRVFLYMPFMHAEDAATQAESVRLFEALGVAENIAFARDHAEVVTRFGRFPSRNAALGRESTEAEREYLATRDSGW